MAKFVSILLAAMGLYDSQAGRIRESVDFDMPRPRDITSPAFNDTKRRVLQLIHAESTRIVQAS